ncbi:MAG: efflux RND transporter periplasmic adaptor subunit [FCB group bacterium]|jgi:Cu(I)/Ag(I) efflux system membrane fusion protein
MNKIKLKWIVILLGIIIIIGGAVAVYLYLNKINSGNQQITKTVKKELWTCTMHPQVISDRPGVCPICNMELVRKTDDSSPDIKEDKNIIKLTENKLALANVSTVTIQKEELIIQIKAFSYMDFAEQNRRTITARFNGRIEKLFVNKTGDYITKGEALFEIYSPELVQAQNEYLIALDGEKNSGTILKSSKKKLEIFGLTDSQIKELETTKEVKMTLKYYSPVAGTVIEKKIQEGTYINEGTALFEIADMSTLWNIAEIYESDLNVVNVGTKVKLTLQSYPGEVFEGRVAFIYPVVNAQTRTVKIRSEFINSRGKLKPQMFGETIFEHNFGSGLVVPSDAILFTGTRNIVWVKTTDGTFESREVKVGMKVNDKYQILSGLNVGEEIVKTGGFLIDSESQLKSDNKNQEQKASSEKTKSNGNMPNMPGMNQDKK